MAEVATPSAEAMEHARQPTPSNAGKEKGPATTRPERPDEEKYKAELAQAEKELRSSEERMKNIKSKLDMTKPNNKDSPTAKRQQDLRSELQSIRQQQQTSKSGRTQVMDKVKRLDENLKSRIAEQKAARSKVAFKSVDDVQREIDRLQKQVDAGNMKIVDEKKALSDISQLNRQKKGFAGFEEAQRGIDDVKAQISELKKSMDDPESKALSDRYTQITTELDQIKAEQDDVYKNINALRDERTKAHEDQQKKYASVKEIKDRYYQSRRAAAEYEKEARRVRDERRKAENDAYHRGRRQEAAKEKLEDASAPAYQSEIRTTQSLLAHFDPSYSQKQTVTSPGKFAAAPSRTVDSSGIKGTALKKKGEDEESYFVGGGGKKNKRNRNQQQGGAASPAPEGKFNLDIGTIDSLAKIGIDPPMSQADVPSVVEKLKEKLEFWKGDQKRKTDENIAAAQKEIDRLEAEAQAADSKAGGATETARTPATEKQGVNGSASAGAQQEQENDGVADATEDLEKAKIEDEKAPEGTV
ncbi:multicopy suppressor of BFA (Brefeldin A) [Saxophila tyrrhenica]|uniref:Multicopy suppressor of BFA (Brefeldin A) n=1 Tax=Saxophila tyrrhenica TaxID=1690608 RepID=A0AAV9P7D8_9PEZI|nr:multicopy suppressor of BFA (Brefeldin A) [Saxophila tyrrhenica]